MLPTSFDEFFQASYEFNMPAAAISQYIQTAARVKDYFPLARHAYELSPGNFIISAWSGATLLETRALTADGLTVEMKVTSAVQFLPPFTAEKIRRKPLLTMTEIWQLEPLPQGCRLSKHWGNLVQHRLHFINLKRTIISTAKSEEVPLLTHWNR